MANQDTTPPTPTTPPQAPTTTVIIANNGTVIVTEEVKPFDTVNDNINSAETAITDRFNAEIEETEKSIQDDIATLLTKDEFYAANLAKENTLGALSSGFSNLVSSTIPELSGVVTGISNALSPIATNITALIAQHNDSSIVIQGGFTALEGQIANQTELLNSQLALKLSTADFNDAKTAIALDAIDVKLDTLGTIIQGGRETLDTIVVQGGLIAEIAPRIEAKIDALSSTGAHDDTAILRAITELSHKFDNHVQCENTQDAASNLFNAALFTIGAGAIGGLLVAGSTLGAAGVGLAVLGAEAGWIYGIEPLFCNH
jgi:hypothetical protein